MVHIVLSFRANLLHGSLETRRANWFLRCFFISSNGTNKQEMCEGGDIDEGEWRKTGDEGVKVVGIILVLESVARILTTAWNQNQSVSIQNESYFMWAGSNNSPCDRALGSHGHSFCHVCLCITITMFTCIQHRFLFYDKFWLFVLCLYLYAVDPKLLWLYALVMDCFYMWVDVDVWPCRCVNKQAATLLLGEI